MSNNWGAVYAIVFNSEKDKILTVKNSKGHYFLPGGGIKSNEGCQECLESEMQEETGYKVSIGSFIGNAKRYFQSTNNDPLINDGYFYWAELLDKIQESIEADHFIKWIDIESVLELLVHEHLCCDKKGLKG
ncbi:NUDIX domain-containing protein [Peribacillus sp. NPDC006672]|uniref:NUDIX domain-containing protein n=1 Tax=Peribacillus sp. NPDC006672 TaxID=3390606 RepID=UPI003D000513